MQQAVADLILRALADLVPERSAAGAHVSDPMITLSGIDDRHGPQIGRNQPRYYVVADGLGGGMGASATADGLDAVDTHSGNCALISAEVIETVSPVRVTRTELTADSGGSGKHRGGLGMLRDYELLAESAVLTGVLQRTRPETAPWGFRGGGAGGPAACIINPGTDREERLSSKILSRKIAKGDVVRIIGGGGGGWGNSAERDPDLAAADRRNGYVS
jgi:N-methylhydantoinase B